MVTVFQGVVGGSCLFDHLTGAFVAVLFMLYSTARHCSGDLAGDGHA